MSKTISKTVKPLQVRTVNPDTARARRDAQHHTEPTRDRFEVAVGPGYVTLWYLRPDVPYVRFVNRRGRDFSGVPTLQASRDAQEIATRWGPGLSHSQPCDREELDEAIRLLQAVAELTR